MEKEISELVAYAKDDANTEVKEIEFGRVSNLQGQKIKSISGGVETNFYPKTLSSIQILHAIKGYGNDTEETKRGQKGLIDSDFEYLPQIVNNPDSLEKASSDYLGRPGVLFKKKMKGLTYHVVMTVKQKKNGVAKLDFATMYIKR